MQFGKSAKYYATKAEELGMNKDKIFTYETKAEAIQKTKDIIEGGDYILVKASHSMEFTDIVKELK